MKTLYQGNLNHKFAFRPTKKEKLKNLFVFLCESIIAIALSIPLTIYIWSWILM